MALLTIELPWPSSKLSPNSRQQHHALARAKRNYRAQCKNATRAQVGDAVRWPERLVSMSANGILIETALKYRLLFFPPNEKSHDRDNLIARMKSGLDGMCDALGIDDGLFVESAGRVVHTMHGGRVLVEIDEDDEAGEWVPA
ncbi:MAG: hypothetical protein KDE27_17085 [Planctomycetes bacterium]|nr:hypothetical protein [Planctomycetota bacterium]